jgi:threonine synthase
MEENFTVYCQSCQTKLDSSKPITVCPHCGSENLEATYPLLKTAVTDPTAARKWQTRLNGRGTTLWRYRELLPLHEDPNIVTLGEGWTPLFRAHNLGLMLGHPNIYIKDERQGPTGSFKDRQAAIAVSAMREAGIKEAVVASTGNVAIAYSAYCARAGIKLWVFVPSSVPPEKMREVAIYGSEVIKVAATYDETKNIAAEFARSKNLFLDKGIRTIGAKEAMKTVAFEIAEQLGSIKSGKDWSIPNGEQYPWQVPDWYLQSISGGMGPIGVMKGFAELKQLGITNKMPKLALFQVAGCAPMVEAFKRGKKYADSVTHPITEIATLATGVPGHAYEMIFDLIQQHGGLMEAIPDEEAFRAVHVVAQMDGLSVEPATAVTFAGLFKLIREGIIPSNETIVLNCTGHTFPVDKHILGDHYTRDMLLNPTEKTGTNSSNQGREEGLLTALEELDSRVQRIAIIEDNPDALRLIRRILQAQGEFLIEEAHNGHDGLQLIKETHPNLVLLDLMMPGLDGFSIVEYMKADPKLKDIPIIVITAKELTAIERSRLKGKIKALLQKGSFMDSDLMSDIRQALPD